jgi:hypothetical protein
MTDDTLANAVAQFVATHPDYVLLAITKLQRPDDYAVVASSTANGRTELVSWRMDRHGNCYWGAYGADAWEVFGDRLRIATKPVKPLYEPKAGTVLIGDGPHTHADLLRCFSGELDRLSVSWSSNKLRAEALALATELDTIEPGTSPLEMDAHELSDKLACELNDIAKRHGLSFWIGDDGVWMYRPIAG